MNLQFEKFTVKQLRSACRYFLPETRGVNGIANSGGKELLTNALIEAGIMACDIEEFIEREKNNAIPSMVNCDEILDADVIMDVECMEPVEPAKNIINNNPESDLNKIREILLGGAPPAIDKKEIEIMIGNIVASKLKNNIKTIEIKPINGESFNIGLSHKLTEQVAKIANTGISQMLVGSAGSGKTTTCEKVAEILQLKFYPMSVGPQTTKSDLLGFINANGNYHVSPLRQAFEGGGLLLLDEVDSANAGVLTVINSMLANGYCSFPDGVIKKHDNFRCICACNTYGRGADRQYVGRNQLDAATLDRFVVIDFDYDEDLERELANNDKWVKRVQTIRKKAFDLKLRIVISPRASIYGAKLLQAGFIQSEVEEMTIFKGVSDEIRSKLA